MRKIIILFFVICLTLTGCSVSKTTVDNQYASNSSLISSFNPSSSSSSNPSSSSSSNPSSSSSSNPSSSSSSTTSGTTTSDPDEHKYCVPEGPVEIEVTEDFSAADGLNIFEKFSGVTLVPVYKVDRNSGIKMTKETIDMKLKYFISGKNFSTMVEEFKTFGFKEKDGKDCFASFYYNTYTTEKEGEEVLYLERTSNGHSSGVMFLKNHAFDNDYYCVAAHINRENPYNSYIKYNRPIGIKGLLSYTPIERTNSTSFLEKIDIIESTR